MIDQMYTADTRENLPTPNSDVSVGITNGGIYQWSEEEDEWQQFDYGTPAEPRSSGFYEQFQAPSLNSTVYASEQLQGFPSIHTALDRMKEEGINRLEIVGGVNEVSSPIDVPTVARGVDARQGVEIVTRGGAVIRQANDANLDAILRTGSAVADVDVTIDGNSHNNSSDVTGIHWQDEQGPSTVQANLFDCSVGLDIVGNTESSRFSVYVNGCDVGVQERGDNNSTPDENTLDIRGHANAGPFYRKTDPGISTDVRFGVETCPGNAVEIEDQNSTTVRGIIRSAGNHGIKVSDGDLILDSVNIISCKGAGVFFDGAKGRANAVTLNNLNTGIIVGGESPSNNIKIAFPNIINVSEYAIEFRRGQGNTLIDPQNVEEGSNSGAAIGIATGGYSTVYMEMHTTQMGKKIEFGDADHELELKWLGHVTNRDLNDFPYKHEGMWGYNSDIGNLTIHDGDNWIRPDGTEVSVGEASISDGGSNDDESSMDEGASDSESS